MDEAARRGFPRRAHATRGRRRHGDSGPGRVVPGDDHLLAAGEQRLARHPDVAGYSSAEDDIRRAELAAIRLDRGNGGPPSLGGGGGGGPGGGSSGPGSGSGGGGFFNALGDRLGPGNAQSIPLPLIVLAGLALLLLLAAGATWLTRRLQSRRVTPATAAAPAGPKRR